MPISTTLPTPLGLFLLTADENGLCGLTFPQEPLPVAPESLVAITTHPLLGEAGRQLRAYLDGTLRDFDLPLSLHGTGFQRQVWEQLLAIPYGQTLTYGELAERIGDRRKARAVGGAAHANPVGIVIPCHRLIGAGGKLTGFGGGLPMKQTLLDLERRIAGRSGNNA